MKVIFNFDYVQDETDYIHDDQLLEWLDIHDWQMETTMDFLPENLSEISLVAEDRILNVEIVERTISVDILTPENTRVFLWVKIEL